MNERQQRAWRALDLGPRWRGRETPEDAVAVVDELPTLPAEQAAILAPASIPVPTPVSTPVPAPAAIPVPGESRESRIAAFGWPELRAEVAGCTACGLCRTRKQTVFGVGDERADWLLIGEAPGAEEDARGEPFVGQAGRLLDSMLAALKLDRTRGIFIANVLKCRPPGNRNPEPSEMASCEPFLRRQIELVAPRVVLLMGRFAAQSMLRSDGSIASLRGKVHRLTIGDRQVPAIVTYHPAYLLRTLPDKAKAWSDLLLARRALQQTPPEH